MGLLIEKVPVGLLQKLPVKSPKVPVGLLQKSPDKSSKVPVGLLEKYRIKLHKQSHDIRLKLQACHGFFIMLPYDLFVLETTKLLL